MENIQTISLKGMTEIHAIACTGWKKKIKEWTNPFGDTELTESQVKEMYNAADSDQVKILDKYLERINSILCAKAKKELSNLELPYTNPKSKEEKCLNATLQLFTIRKVYNEGKDSNWKDSNELKYFIYKDFSRGGALVCSGVWCCNAHHPLGLYFVSRELVEDVIKNFPEVINDYFMI